MTNPLPQSAGLIFGKGLVACSLWLLLFTSPARAAERQILRGHVPAAVEALNLQPKGQLAATNHLQLAIGLPLRNREALASLLAQIYDPASPQYHRYLAPEQFAERFGPAEEDYQAVIAFAEAQGLKVIARHPNRVLLDVSGSVADIEKAFQVTLRLYPHPGEAGAFYAPDVEPSLDLGVPVLSVSGLNNYVLPHPNLRATPVDQLAKTIPLLGSGPSGTYMGNDFRRAYVPNVSLTGAGQVVGLLEFDGFYAKDITAFGRVVELGADEPVGDEEGAAEHDGRHGEDHHEGRHHLRPHEQWDAVQGHTRRAQLEGGDDDFDRHDKRGGLREGDHLCPEVLSLAGAVLRTCKWDVAEPTGLGPDVEDERHEDHDAPQRKHPVAEGIEAREGDISGTHHERHEENAHRLHDRYGKEEHHDRAMHGEELIVKIRTDQMLIRLRELRTHEGGHQSGPRKEEERRYEVTPRDPFVIDRREPAHEAGAVRPPPVEFRS